MNRPNARPRVGQIVHYVSRGSTDRVHTSECRGAQVFERSVDGTVCGLFVVTPNGTYHNDGIPFSEDKNPGTWHWLCEDHEEDM